MQRKKKKEEESICPKEMSLSIMRLLHGGTVSVDVGVHI